MFEILLIVVLLLVVLGAGKVRSAGSDLGAAVKNFRRELRGPGLEPPAGETPHAPPAAAGLPDAEFPEVLAARSRGSGKPGA
ncbi:MAG TPA: twin-arginine translocase TatA/TatE family subunit [Steroidobacteraceae bacterium]|nr:twin-arginine translocase TatA/TatE family subunit [Steroidobacteraceae bacterium]